VIPPDGPLSCWLTGLAGKFPVLDHTMTLFVCDFFVPVSLSLILLFFWFGTGDRIQRERNQHGAVNASVSLGIANLVVWLLNHVVELNPWPRPFQVYPSAHLAAQIVFYYPHDPSFPANAAATTFAAAAGMWFYNRRASLPLFLLAFLFSFARVYAGVHYPLDILGGLVIGVFTGYACYRFLLLPQVDVVVSLLFTLGRKLYLA